MIDILSTGGDLDTPKITRVYWAVLEGVAAGILLLVGGSGTLTALQTASIATAVPFSIVLVLACVSLLRAFRYDVATTPRYLRVASQDTNDAGQTSVPPLGRQRAQGISSNFGGLSPSTEGIAKPSNGVLVAVHDVSADTVDTDPDTGTLSSSAVQDPPRGETFDDDTFADLEQPEAQLR